eukprot:scaffold190337_cov11-Prasinocladus_malaysianus.AAC.1
MFLGEEPRAEDNTGRHDLLRNGREKIIAWPVWSDSGAISRDWSGCMAKVAWITICCELFLYPPAQIQYVR